jgi:hypothetical protein
MLSSTFEGDATSTKTDRSKKAAVPVGMLLHLVSVGLVGAATIILFSIASVSLLGTGKEPLAGCRIADGVFRYADGNAALFPAQTYSPALDLATILPAFRRQGPSTSETLEVTQAKRGFKLPSPDRYTSTATSEARDAAVIRGPAINKTQSSGVGWSEQAATERRPIADEASGTSVAFKRIGPREIVDKGRDQEPRNIEIQRNEPATPNQDDVSFGSKSARTEGAGPARYGNLLRPNAAFRYRLQKECGPIIFPALYRHCVASFGVHHR